jgi:hypothetical protein
LVFLDPDPVVEPDFVFDPDGLRAGDFDAPALAFFALLLEAVFDAVLEAVLGAELAPLVLAERVPVLVPPLDPDFFARVDELPLELFLLRPDTRPRAASLIIAPSADPSTVPGL